MAICGKRPEGFGPNSPLSSPIPTSCFVDTILIPLPIWLSLLILPILILLNLHHRKSNYNPSTVHLRAVPTRSCGYKTAAAIYYILIIANSLMEVLEIVRLELIYYGIGLLPFVLVGLILGGYLHWSEGAKGRIRYWQVINGFLWVGGTVMSAVKVVGLCSEAINARKGSKYPMEDQVTDTAVMAGVYAIIAVLEIVLGMWMRKRVGKTGEEMSLGSEMSPVFGNREFAGK